METVSEPPVLWDPQAASLLTVWHVPLCPALHLPLLLSEDTILEHPEVSRRVAVTAAPSVLLSQGLGSGALNEHISRNQETNLVSISNLPCDLGHLPALGPTSLWVNVWSLGSLIALTWCVQYNKLMKNPILILSSTNIY